MFETQFNASIGFIFKIVRDSPQASSSFFDKFLNISGRLWRILRFPPVFKMISLPLTISMNGRPLNANEAIKSLNSSSLVSRRIGEGKNSLS